MRRRKIELDDEQVYLNCAHCGLAEEVGIDESRKRLAVLPIVKWHDDADGQNEVSVHKCSECGESFEVEWDYDNPIFGRGGASVSQ